jgi:hypothetical protein
MYPGTFAVTTPDTPATITGLTGEVVCHQALDNRSARLVPPGPGDRLHWAPFLVGRGGPSYACHERRALGQVVIEMPG